MFAVTVTFTIHPDSWIEFVPLMRGNAMASLRQEPGCFQFDVALDPDHPNEVFLYELFTDKSAFKAHLDSEHFKSFDGAVAPMIAAQVVRTYREVMQ